MGFCTPQVDMEDVEREWDYPESSSTQRSHQFFLLVSRYLGMVERTEHWEVHDKARSGPQSDDEQSRLPKRYRRSVFKSYSDSGRIH